MLEFAALNIVIPRSSCAEAGSVKDVAFQATVSAATKSVAFFMVDLAPSKVGIFENGNALEASVSTSGSVDFAQQRNYRREWAEER